MGKNSIKILIGAILAIIILFFLFREIKLSDLKEVFLNLSWGWLILAFLSYISCYKMRAMRFNTLFKSRIRGIFSIVSINTMFNNLIPARLGELSFLYLAKKQGSSSLGESAGVLVFARIVDLLIVAIIFLFGVAIVPDVPDIFRNVILTVAIFMIVVIVFLALLIIKGNFMANIFRKILEALRLDKFKIFQKIINEIDNILASFTDLKNSHKITKVFIFTFLAWSFNYIFVYFFIQSAGIKVSLGGILLSATFVVLTSILPINTPGGFGVIEGVWAASLFSLGISKELAISSGFAYHVVLLMFSILLGTVGYLRLKKSQKETTIKEFNS